MVTPLRAPRSRSAVRSSVAPSILATLFLLAPGLPAAHALTAASIDFEAPRFYPGFYTTSPVGDFDGDGIDDVVSSGLGGLILHRGLGGRRFVADPQIPIVFGPGLAADIDGDGDLDLIGTAENTNLQVLLGDGSGGFSALTPMAFIPSNIFAGFGATIGDVDLDGDLDLVLERDNTSTAPEMLSILLGDGAGGFTVSQEFPGIPNTGAPPSNVAFDHDTNGWPDIVLNLGNNAAIALALGSGQFAAPVVIPELRYVTGVADLDADGFPDLVGAPPTNDTVRILRGNGTGNSWTVVDLPGYTFSSSRIGDVDGNGALDLVVTHGTSQSGMRCVAVLDGTDAPAYTPLSDECVPGMSGVSRVEDFDGDGNLDLFSSQCTSAVVYGDGTGSFPFVRDFSPVVGGAGLVAVGDLNDDGFPDVVAQDAALLPVLLLSGPGGDLGTPTPIDSAMVLTAEIVDLDQDGDLDLFLAGTERRIFWGDGTGALLVGPNLPPPPAAPNINVWGSVVADFDGNGLPEIAMVHTGYSGASSHVQVLHYDATESEYVLEATFAIETNGFDLVAADHDGSGTLDLIVSHDFGPITVIPQGNDGFFLDPVEVPAPVGVGRSIAAGDIDLDGFVDLVLGEDFGGDARVLFGDGAGGYVDGGLLPSTLGSQHVSIVDLDGNGRSEIVVGGDILLACGVMVYAESAPRVLELVHAIDAGGQVRAMELADLDGDDRLDIVAFVWHTNSQVPSGVTRILNTSTPPRFVRGDCNQDLGIDISDAIYGLTVLFTELGPAPCIDACDVNDDGLYNIADMIWILGGLFSGGPPPLAPWPDCGVDPTDDDDADCRDAAGC